LDDAEAEKAFCEGTKNFDAYMDVEVVSWMHQIALSLDFAERDFGQAVEGISVFGDGAKSADVREMLAEQSFRQIDQPDLKSLLESKFSMSYLPEDIDSYILPVIEGAEIMLGDLNNED